MDAAFADALQRLGVRAGRETESFYFFSFIVEVEATDFRTIIGAAGLGDISTAQRSCSAGICLLLGDGAVPEDIFFFVGTI